MSIATLSSLVQSLDELHLLTAAQRTEMERDLLSRLGEPKVLASELLRRGWLTPYQVNQLLQGNNRGLRLGQYVFLERLGEGGTGKVFKARHLTMNRIVALKIIRPELTADAEVVARFYREIQVISQLNHPNIIHAFDAGPEGTTHTLIMEYVDGIDLAKLVKQSGPLPVDRACDFIRQTACGLAHAHQRGLVHRDIKPSNLLLVQAHGLQSVGTVKILDLGLARLQRNANGELTSTLTPVGSVTMGTPDYLAPEQALNFHQVDIRADIYSLGCTLFFLLTGQPPFPGGSLAQKILRHQQAEPPRLESICPGLPPVVPAIVNRMLAKLPQDRFQTPAEVVDALGALKGMPATPAMSADTTSDWLAETPPRAEILVEPPAAKAAAMFEVTVKQFVPPPGPGARFWNSRRRLLAAALGALGLVGVLLIGFLTMGRGKPPTSLTAASQARLDRLQGQVFITTGGARLPARLGADLRPGQQVRTTGPDSLARLNLDDRIFVELGPDTVLEELPKDGLARRLKMDGPGLLQGEVRQASGRPLVLVGPHGEVKVPHGRFRWAATPQTSWLRVDEGTVQLKQTGSTRSVDVPSGRFAAFGPSVNAVVNPLTAGIRVVDDFETVTYNWIPFVGNNNSPRNFTRKWVSPGKVGKRALRVDYNLGPTPQWSGMAFGVPKQDWSKFRNLHFWFHGCKSNNGFDLILYVSDLPGGVVSWSFKDDIAGWREFCIPLSAFRRQGKTSDFRAVSKVVVNSFAAGQGSYQIDQLELLEHEILR